MYLQNNKIMKKLIFLLFLLFPIIIWGQITINLDKSHIREQTGGLTYVSTPGTQTINTGGTFERLNEGAIAYTAIHLYNFTHDDGRLTYTGIPTIHVTITVALAAESGETAQVTNFRIAKDGTTIAATDMPITFTALDFAANTPLKWLDEVATNSYYEIFGTSDTDADEFDINTLVFTITKH